MLHRRVAAIVGASLLLGLAARDVQPAARQDRQEPLETGRTAGEPFTGEPGIVETVGEIMRRDARLPREAFALRLKKEREVPFEKRQDPMAAEAASWPPISQVAAESLSPQGLEPKLPQTVGASFLGIQGPGAESPYVPPDSVGDVGPTQVLVGANGRIKVFDKTGVLGALNTSMENFFSSVSGAPGVSDPHIRYDRLSGRWFVVIITVSSCPNSVLIAVSSGPTITSGSSFTFFSFTPETTFIDYPTLGVDKNALYIGGNIFNCAGNALTGVSAYVVRKANLLGGTASATIFRGLEGAGIWTPQGVDNDDPGATEGYFIGVDFNLYGRLGVLRVIDPGGAAPTLSAQLNVTVPTTSRPMAQPQPGGGPVLDGLDDRLLAAAIHKNKVTGALTLCTAHNIKVNASGVGTSAGNRNGSRWYEIGTLNAAPTLIQSGTLFDPAATTPFGYWMASVAMSGQGHVALAASRASTDASLGFASISAAGRLRTDAAGTTQAPTLAQGSTSAYDTFVAGTERWGDFSQTVVDPSDDQTMWTFQEYASGTNTWGVRAIQLRAPAPATPATASPSSVPTGQASVDVVVTGTSVAGSEFFDPGPDTGGPGFASHIAASVSGGVTVNSVTFDSPTQITLNISTVGTPFGTKNVIVANPDGQAATGTGILTVACPTITVNPSSIPAATTGSAYSQTFTQTGGTGTITWSYTGTQPTGLSLNPTTGVLSGTPTQLGSFTFTVIATDSNVCTGNRAVTLTVNRAFPFVPIALSVDSAGNSVLEAGETVVVAPSWRNTTGAPESVTGTASAFTGPGSPDPTYSITDAAAGYGLVGDAATVGCAAATGNCYSLGLSTPTARPLRHWDSTFLETLSGGDTKTWTLHVGDSFDDVSRASGFYPFIETLFHKSITAGCSTTGYCPTLSTLREQMAVFVLRAKEGPAYSPIACGSSPTFSDVPASSPYCRFIEELARRGVVAGCGSGAYCPTGPVLREQMAVFVLRTLDPTLVPPACTTPIFNDVPASNGFCPWIEELYRRGVVVGCGGGNYCPTNPVTRDQMGVFISKTFGLTLYGP